MTILVTGGAGFIGSRLAKRLLGNGHKVVILDNFDDYYDVRLKRANIEWIGDDAVLVEGDIRDKDTVERVYADYGIRRVAHLAALAGVRASAENGHGYTEVNTLGSVVLMDAARRHDVELFVLGSTSSVYGNTNRIPFVEDDAADHPLAPYPASKRAAELLAHSYYHLFGLNVTVLRFFNVYGPQGRPDMMPLRVIDAILKDKPIPIFDGGSLKRDWTYVEDIVDGLVSALTHPLGYQILNFGFGAPISLLAFIEVYEKLIGKQAVLKDVPAPRTEPLITYCNNTRARELLNFAPKVPIQEGLANTWAWYRDHYQIVSV
jgi:UDP-glucuronate 4-epimerase